MHRVAANGANIPALGFGTWTLEGDDARSLVSQALDCGYRHVDTAAMYGNEASVGEGLAVRKLGAELGSASLAIAHRRGSILPPHSRRLVELIRCS